MRRNDFESPGYSGRRAGPLIGFHQADEIHDISNYGSVRDYNVRMIPGPRHFDTRHLLRSTEVKARNLIEEAMSESWKIYADV